MINFLIPLLLLVSCGKPITEGGGAHLKNRNELHVGVHQKNYLGLDMYLNFNYLPLRGEIKRGNKFWSGDSWRLINGSINYRWNSPAREGRFTTSPHPRELKHLSEKDIMSLAPSEKYDLLIGRYDYALKSDIDRFLPDSPLDWEGLCHGWAGASMNHVEPRPKVLINPDGLKIPFGSADIKALLTYYYAGLNIPDEYMVGKRCELSGIVREDFCDNDVTPVDFHTILTNKLGLRGDSFIADIDRFIEVWNHPITSYEGRILTEKRTSTGRKIRIRMSLGYVDVVEKSYWERTNGTLHHISSIQELEYELDLDRDGNMIGGKWISRDRPDFIWTIDKVNKFTGYLSALSLLVDDI